MPINDEHRQILRDTARCSIEHGLRYQTSMPVIESNYPEPLRQNGASFVTLHFGELLHGCIGSLLPYHALIEDVAQNAHSAAFRDPRNGILNAGNVADLTIHISVLSQPEILPCSSEDDLLKKVRPGVDGLIIEDLGFRGTLLPSVWEQLSDPRDFVRHVKLKAGLPREHWSPTLTVKRYTTEIF